MTMQLTAEYRSKTGKGITRKLRQEGKVPAVLYSPLKQPIAITLNTSEVTKTLAGGGGRKIIEMVVKKNAESETCEVLFKDIQRNSINGELVHIDFYEIQKGHNISATVPIILEGKPVGVVDQGGALQFLTRAVRIQCLPRNLPESIKVDVTSVNLGQNITVETINTNPDVTIMEEPLRVIASVIAIKKTIASESEEEEETSENVVSE